MENQPKPDNETAQEELARRQLERMNQEEATAPIYGGCVIAVIVVTILVFMLFYPIVRETFDILTK